MVWFEGKVVKLFVNFTAIAAFLLGSISALPAISNADVATQPPKSALSIVGKKASFFGATSAKFSIEDLGSRGRMAPSVPVEEPVVEKAATTATPDKFAVNVDGSGTAVAVNPEVAPGSTDEEELRKKLLKRVSANAPDEFKDLAFEFRKGNMRGAGEAADRYVLYLQNLMFEVREITKIIGAAMIRNGIVDPEDWVGVEQYIDYEAAMVRQESGMSMDVPPDIALKRVVPDQNQQALVYYFFSLNCSYCRKMAPDVERLYQSLKGDKKVKMVALTLGPQPKAWIDSYREYTGMTMPIMEGAKVAKTFNVAFVPALVVVSPSSKKAYLKTGQQEFVGMYQFVRAVQGLPYTVTPTMQYWAKQVIGNGEKMIAKARIKAGVKNGSTTAVALPQPVEQGIKRF